MACSKYSSTRQTTHAARMSRLLFGPCTDLLRDGLRIHIPETSFPATLQNRRVKGILLRLRNLQASQRELLYPQVGTFGGSYEDFDISLLYLLLRNITNINPHSNGWGSPPDQTDRSVSANIDRIRMIRNQIGAHCHRHDLSDAVFSTSWAKLKRCVVEIVRSTGISTNYEQFINDLAIEPMDPSREDYWLEVLQKQIQDDAEKYQEIVKTVESIQEKIKGMSSEQDKQTQMQRNQGEVQIKHGATLTEHEDRLNKQDEVQTAQVSTLTKHNTTMTEHQDRLTKHGEVQSKHGATLTEHAAQLTRQGKVQTKHGATLTELQNRFENQDVVQTKHGSTLTQHEDRLTKQGVTLKEHEKRINKQEEAQNQEVKNILDNTEAVLQNHKSSPTYVRTGQVETVKQKLREKHIVFLTGRPGDGKSTIAKQVLCELSHDKEYVPVILTEPCQWDKAVNPNQNMAVYIDDMFGASNVDTNAIEKWKKNFDKMMSSANKGKVLVLISSRRYILAEIRKSCYERFLNPEYEIDLTSNGLTPKEKESMVLQYENVHVYKSSELVGDEFRKYGEGHGKDAIYKLSKWERKEIVSSEPYYGFPQTCFLFFARKDFFQLGRNFFLRPNKSLFENFDNMRKSMDVRTKMRYCTLAYVFLEGSINLRDIKDISFQEICERSSLSKWTEVDVEDAVQDLEGIYLLPSNQTHVFTFCHVTIREAVAASFGKLAPDIVIQKCSREILQELIRTEGCESRDGEVILTIRNKYYSLLANRMLTEGTGYSVEHPATDDAEFLPVLFDFINKSSHYSRTIIKEIWDELKYKDKPVLYREILTRHGPHHIEHKAEYDMPEDELDSNASLERPYLITREEVKARLDDPLFMGHKQTVIVFIRYVISNCDVSYFLNSYNDDDCQIRGMSVLHYCVARGWTDVLDEILNVVTPTKTENNWSCLHFAASFGRFELFKKFEKLSSNVLETTREGYNILQVILLGLRYGMYVSGFAECYLTVSDTYDSYVYFWNLSPHETDFINILQHVMTGYPSLITSIDMPLDRYNNNIIHYLVIHDQKSIYDVLMQKRKDLIFHRNNTKLPSTLHVAAYLGRVKFVEKLWNAGVRARETDISIAKSFESGQIYSDRTVTYETNFYTGMYQWEDQHEIVINNIKLKCIKNQAVRFGHTEDYIAITSICFADN